MAEEKTYNEHLFKNEKLWENYDSHGEIAQKVEIILEKIPNDVQSILDIGCGNGIITNRLNERYQVTGVDNSAEALAHLEGSAIQSSCADIPVEDQSYDMVFSSELLEHLDDSLLSKTIIEFRRIAKKYVMIAVPNNEQLQRSWIKCPDCKKTFHVYGHIQTYTPQGLVGLMGTDWKLLWHTALGHNVQYFNLPLLNIRQKTFGQYFPANEFTICPHCSNREFSSPPKNIFTKIINGTNKVIAGTGKPYWLLTLFEKN